MTKRQRLGTICNRFDETLVEIRAREEAILRARRIEGVPKGGSVLAAAVPEILVAVWDENQEQHLYECDVDYRNVRWFVQITRG